MGIWKERFDFARSWVSLPAQPIGSPRILRDLGILALVFVLARGVGIAAILLRGKPLVRSDGANYIAIAMGLLEGDGIPLDQRQFPGFGILIAILSWCLRLDPVASGLLLVFLPGIGAICAFYLLTRNFRLSLLLVFVLPGWASTGIMAEGLAMLCLLCAIAAFGNGVKPGAGAALAFVGGVLVVIKPPLVLAIAPLGAVAAWGALSRMDWGMLLRGVLFLIPMAVYAIWAMNTLGTLRPEAAEQLRYTIEQSRGYYPERLLSWPGHSLVLGLLDPTVSPIKQASVLFTLGAVFLGAFGHFLMGRERTPLGSTGIILGLGVLIYAVFHLSVGGPWGFNTTERYLGQISPLVLVGLFGERRPRAWVVALGIVGSLGYTALAGRQM